jgi:ribosomal protein S18 acetylase RimI-like enzyme
MAAVHRDDVHPVRVRHVRAAEWDRLRALRLASLAADPGAFGSTYAREDGQDPSWWRAWAARSDDGTTQRTYLVVGEDDRWHGLALVRLDDDDPAAAVLNAMWVEPAARGRGLAGVLCDACATWATERGCHELTLQVVVDNDAALRAYQAAGFSVRGRSTWSRDGRTLDELDMVRPLHGPAGPG